MSKEDFARILKTSETSVLGRVQSMLGREKSSDRSWAPFACTDRGRNEEIVSRGEWPGSQGVEAMLREEWFKFNFVRQFLHSGNRTTRNMAWMSISRASEAS